MRISYSQMSTYLNCGIKYEKRYIERIPQLSTPTLVAGRAIHSGIELNYRQKINTRKDLPVSDLKDCVADAIERGFQEELFLMEDEKAVTMNSLKADWKDLSVKGIEAYHREISPQVFPVEAEHNFLVPLQDNHQLYGFIDIVDERKIIRDTKTSKKMPFQKTADRNVADESQQLTAYALAYKTLYGELPEKLTLDYIILNGEVKTIIYETARKAEDIEVFMKRLRRVVNGIQRRVFCRPQKHGFVCTVSTEIAAQKSCCRHKKQ